MKWATAIDQWTDWLRAGGLRATTITLRRYQVMRFAERHLDRSPWKVKTRDLITWLSEYDWKPETRRSYRASVRGFYRWAVLAGHVKRSPAEILPTSPPPLTAPRPTPDAIFTAALTRADDRVRLILMCAAYAGMRRAEIAGLRWDHVTDTSIRVVGKGGRVRLVPKHRTLGRELEAERARRAVGETGTGYRYTTDIDVYVFPGQAGGPMSPHALGKIAGRALGGHGWTAHTLRHRFATRAYAGSRDLVAVQELLGHSKPETTRRYTQAPDGALAAAVDAV